MRINNLLALPPRVADLRPKMVAAAGARGRPRLQRHLHRSRGLTVYDDVTRTLQMIPVDLHISGQQEPCPTIAPYAVQLIKRRRGLSGGACQTFRHRGLAQSIGDFCTARQREWLFNHLKYFLGEANNLLF